MSKSAVQQVIQRATSDAGFRRQLQRDPKGALAGFDLTADERAAVTSGDPTKLTALGVDQRMSKAFNLGAEVGASSSIVGDATSGATAGITDEVSQSGSAALVSDDAGDGSAVLVGDPDAGATSVLEGAAAPSHLQMIEQDLNSPDLSAISGDPDAGATSALEGSAAPSHLQMVEQDLNSPDLSVISGDQVAGTQVTVDDGQSDASPSAFEDGGSGASTDDSLATGTDDAGADAPSIDADTTTFDGHVDVQDQPTDY